MGQRVKEEVVRVLRILEYVGPRSRVEQTLNNGAVPANGQAPWANSGGLTIRSAVVGSYPEILERVRIEEVPDGEQG